MQSFLILALLPFLISCTTTSKWPKPAIIELPDTKNIKESDLDPIRSEIGNKRVVMLGESIHITSEFSKARDVLIRNLHDRGSFNHLFFEGSPIEFWIAGDEFLSSKQDEQAVANFQKTALFGLWQTPEIRSLLAYALASQNDKKSSALYISSYDVQIGQGRIFGSGKKQVLPEFVNRLKNMGIKFNQKEQKKILSLENLVFCKRKKFPATSADYENSLSAIHSMQAHIGKIKADKQTITHHQFLSFIPESLKYSLDFCHEVNSSKRNYTEVRDEWASRQFQAILSQTNEKAIVWAHSGHVRQGPAKDGRMSFGTYMRKLLPNEIFSISFTGKEGSAISFMDEKGNETELTERPLIPIEKASLETKLSRLSQKDFFYSSKKSDNYIQEQETARTEPDFTAPINPYRDFDGYYFIQKISPPRLFLP